MSDFLVILIAAILVNNFVLVQFLGLCPFMGVSNKLETAIGMGAATTFVLTLASLSSYLVYYYILAPLELEYLRTISFIVVIAVVVNFTEMVMRKTSPLLYRVLGVFLPLITSNCAVLGVALLNINQANTFIESILYGIGAALGFSLVLVLFAAMRERLVAGDVPASFQGGAIAMITAGLMSLSFMGFAGLLLDSQERGLAYWHGNRHEQEEHDVMMAWFTEIPLLDPVLALAGLALVFGALLGFAAQKFKVEGDPIVDQINTILPQTQCGQCGYPGCRPYAEAIAGGDDINKCPPGGDSTIHELADLLGVEPKPLDEEHGVEDLRKVAFIREDECIGCTKCIQACPVDAILGAAKQMHTVIVSECTGCDLCVEPCPVDCIDMIPAERPLQSWHWPLPGQSNNIIATDRASDRAAA